MTKLLTAIELTTLNKALDYILEARGKLESGTPADKAMFDAAYEIDHLLRVNDRNIRAKFLEARNA